MSENKKNIWLAVAGVGALIGAALLYHYASGNSESEEAPSRDELVQELKAAGLDEVQKDKNGMIESRYFLKLLQFVGATTRERTAPKRKALTEQRRKHYKSKNWSEYENVVRSFIEVEDSAAQNLLKEVLEILNIMEQEFAMTHQMLASNPQYAEFVMAAQQGKLQQPNVNKQPSLTKQKTLETLAHQEELTIKQMAAMKDKPMPETGDQMEMMVVMMVEQNKMQDEMYERTGVENDDFEDSLLYFVSKDPEVAAAMQKYMMKMRQSMGMGMPGMPGGM